MWKRQIIYIVNVQNQDKLNTNSVPHLFANAPPPSLHFLKGHDAEAVDLSQCKPVRLSFIIEFLNIKMGKKRKTFF